MNRIVERDIARQADAKDGIRIILASNSPRRQSLLRERGYRFEIMSPPIVEPEPCSPGQIPAHWAEALSYFKARSVAVGLDSGYVLAADTIVTHGGDIFGKPADAEDARNILARLSGTTHQVITGVTLLDVAGKRRWIRHECTEVTMRALTEEQVDAYIQSCLWEGKAGAYGIQDRSDANIERLSGSYTNVVGLPMELVESMLEAAGILDLVRIRQAHDKV